MRLILFDVDTETRAGFYPLVLGRPIWDLRCGMTSIAEKLVAKLAPADVACFVPPYMADSYRAKTDRPVNDPANLAGADLLLVAGHVKAEALDVAATGPGEEAPASQRADPPARPLGGAAPEAPDQIAARLRGEGHPAVTGPEANLAEHNFLRSFAQRLERIEELPDPLSGRSIRLREARVKHQIAAARRGTGDLPANRASRFVLRAGGWGRPKRCLTLEAQFLSRPERLRSAGYDRPIELQARSGSRFGGPAPLAADEPGAAPARRIEIIVQTESGDGE